MFDPVCLVAEPTRELRTLIASSLTELGFAVTHARTPDELFGATCGIAAAEAPLKLFVVGHGLFREWWPDMVSSIGRRALGLGEAVAAIFVVDAGAASTFRPPDVFPCEVLGVLERPGSIDGFAARLQALAMAATALGFARAQGFLRPQSGIYRL